MRLVGFIAGGLAVAALAACSDGGNDRAARSTTVPAAVSTSSTTGSTTVALQPTEPPRVPRFADEFDCVFAMDEASETPGAVLAGPGFCDDPVIRGALFGSTPWIADPGNGRPCVTIPDMEVAGPSVYVACDDSPPADVSDRYCQIMQRLEPAVAAAEPDGPTIVAGLTSTLELLPAGDAHDWMEKLHQVWSGDGYLDQDTSALNQNGFGYAQIACGFSYERIGEPPSAALPSVPGPTVPGPMEVDEDEPSAGSWIAMLASIPIDRRGEADATVASWSARGLAPIILDSRTYEGLGDPYWVIALVDFGTETDASEACSEIMGSPTFSYVSGCEPRQL